MQATPVPVHCDSRVTTRVADARRLTPAQLARSFPAGFSTVLSDMAPATSGITSLDATRSQVLAELAVRIALGDDVSAGDDAAVNGIPRGGVLRPGGALVLKLLEGDGSDRQALQALTVPRFRKVHWMRPKATRQESCEVYLVATGLLARQAAETQH
jgi:23S rRNA (uridine2552-2'-O)-methyltransferase